MELLEGVEFEELAELFLNGAEIICPAATFRIIEIEFYLYSVAHPDPFVHRAADQLSVGQWYFHKTGQSYRGGTFKGLDITFARNTGEIIEGPCMCVNKLLRETQCAAVADLAQGAISISGGDMLQVQWRPLERCTIYRITRGGRIDLLLIRG